MNFYHKVKTIDITTGIQIHRFLRIGFLILTSIVLAKLYVDQDDIGIYEWCIHLTYVLAFFWSYGLFQNYLLYSREKTASERFKLRSSLWAIVLIFSAILLVVFYLFQDWGAFLLLGVHEVEYWPQLITIGATGVPLILFEYFLIEKKQSLKLILWSGFSHFFQFLTVCGAFFFHLELTLFLKLFLACNLIRLAYVFYELGVPKFYKLDHLFIKQWIKLASYFGIGGMALVFDTWFIGYQYQSSDMVALFRYGAREIPLVVILLGSIHIGSLGQTFNDTALGKLRQRVLKSIHIMGPIAILLALFSPILFEWFYNPQFVPSAYIFMIYLLIIISRWVLSHTLIFHLQAFNLILVTSIIEFLINVGLSILFFNFWGIVGVAIATVIAYTFEKIVYAVFLWKRHQIKPNSYIPLKPYLIYSVLLLVAVLLNLQII